MRNILQWSRPSARNGVIGRNSMAGKKKELIQLDNKTCVVVGFNGVPCGIDVYPDDKSAIKRFTELVVIHTDVAKQQNGKEPVVEHLDIEKGRRVKTSRSGLPACRFDDGFSVTVVRGPIFGKKTLPEIEYIAVCSSGNLAVVGFEDKAQARNKFKEIRKSYEGETSLMDDPPDKDGHCAFSTDEVSVAYGVADIVRKGEACHLQ